MKKLCIAILVFTAAVSSFAQTKTVTNEDLEKFRQQRVEAEKRLRERYAELGFPAPEQIARQNDARRAEMEEYSDVLRQRRLESQNEIVAEANELRAELAAIDAQLNYLRSQTGGSTYKGGTVSDLSGYSYGGYAPFGVYGGYRNYRGNRGYRGNRAPLAQISRLPQNMRTVQEYGAMYPSSQSIFRQSLGNTRIGGRLNYNNRGYYRGGYVGIAPVIVGGVYSANDAGAEITYLEQQRAGLLARWQILEEQARRAGIRLN